MGGVGGEEGEEGEGWRKGGEGEAGEEEEGEWLGVVKKLMEFGLGRGREGEIGEGGGRRREFELMLRLSLWMDGVLAKMLLVGVLVVVMVGLEVAGVVFPTSLLL